jgi:hypothetical protein
MSNKKDNPDVVDLSPKLIGGSDGSTQRGNALSKIIWTPPWCRWNVNNPPSFTIWYNLMYATAGGFLSANAAYSLPILNVLAEDFGVTQAGVANIPTLAQAGTASCLLLILPLADFFPRRHFVIILTFLSAIFW